MPFFPLPKGNISILLRKKRFLVLGMHGSAFLCWMNGNKMAATIQCITVQTLILTLVNFFRPKTLRSTLWQLKIAMKLLENITKVTKLVTVHSFFLQVLQRLAHLREQCRERTTVKFSWDFGRCLLNL